MKQFALFFTVSIFFNTTHACMLDSLKLFIKEKDSAAVLKIITDYSEVLEEKNQNHTSGFMLVAYSGLQNAFDAAKRLKTQFSFHEAIVAGKENYIQEIIVKTPALCNAHSPDGFTPLSLAALFDQTEIALWLLKAGANPNLQASNPSKVNALHSAVAKENFDLCKAFAEHGVDVNAKQMQGVTALHSAAHRGNLKIVQLLVKAGADINLQMTNGDTALSIAGRDKHVNVVEYLKKHQ